MVGKAGVRRPGGRGVPVLTTLERLVCGASSTVPKKRQPHGRVGRLMGPERAPDTSSSLVDGTIPLATRGGRSKRGEWQGRGLLSRSRCSPFLGLFRLAAKPPAARNLASYTNAPHRLEHPPDGVVRLTTPRS